MEPEHRKIELQSPGDLTYIQAQIRNAARQKLDLHLPAVSDGAEPDDLRRKTEELVDAFVAQVLEGMRHNISINGMDVVHGAENGAVDGVVKGVEEEEFEDLDNKLRERLRTAIARRDALVGKIAQHRRTTPALASQRFRDQFGREMEGLEAARAESEKNAIVLGDGDVVGIEGLKRQEEVERNWQRAVEGLERLNKGLPETRARLERCGDVVGYLEGKTAST
jgi:kinetochor protein Mis14/NSL1